MGLEKIGIKDDEIKRIHEIISKIKQLYEMSVTEIKEYYSGNIEFNCSLGEKGWVVNYKITPIDSRPWLSLIEDKGEEAIMEFFSESVIGDMIDNIGNQYSSNPEKFYFERALGNYKIGNYIETCFFLAIMLEYRN